MTLNHSKTWPVSTLAVVQLRVDTHGRAYSTLNESCEKQCQDFGQNVEENGGLLPQGRLEILAKMRATIRTDTVSTILDQDTEVELEHAEKQGMKLLIICKSKSKLFKTTSITQKKINKKYRFKDKNGLFVQNESSVWDWSLMSLLLIYSKLC